MSSDGLIPCVLHLPQLLSKKHARSQERYILGRSLGDLGLSQLKGLLFMIKKLQFWPLCYSSLVILEGL